MRVNRLFPGAVAISLAWMVASGCGGLVHLPTDRTRALPVAFDEETSFDEYDDLFEAERERERVGHGRRGRARRPAAQHSLALRGGALQPLGASGRKPKTRLALSADWTVAGAGPSAVEIGILWTPEPDDAVQNSLVVARGAYRYAPRSGPAYLLVGVGLLHERFFDKSFSSALLEGGVGWWRRVRGFGPVDVRASFLQFLRSDKVDNAVTLTGGLRF